MENVNKEVKTLLAKLLATEDISVVHRNMPSAYFDTKNRELGLPILKNMTGDIYDLMTLHEVGHALWTDPEEWAEIVNAENDDDLPKSFINVTEDVRIERKIKDKYPGGRRAFATGYGELYKDNFFGTAGRDISESNLADRINLYSKIGEATGLTFEGEESDIYNLCKNAVTFKDAISAARALYAYCKDVENMDGTEFDDDHDFPFASPEYSDDWEENDELDDTPMMGEAPADWNDDSEDSEGKSGMSGKSDDESEDGSGKSSADKFKDEVEKAMDEMKTENDAKSKEESEEKSEEGSPKELSRTGGFGMGKTTNSMQASTVVEWEERKRDLNHDDGKEYHYASVPKSTMKNIVDYKKIMDHCSVYYTDRDSEKWLSAALQHLNDFEKESMKSVNYMIKEFEMKKSADAYVRATISKTGQLDMTKVHSYKYNEDLFKKITIMPGEKNHGLVILIDWSGSMNNVIHNAWKQLMQLVWFCRRAGIKFEVFAFSDSAFELLGKSERYHEYSQNPYWNYKLGDESVSDHVLLNLFSSRMSKMETKRMAHYFCAITVSMIGRWGYRQDSTPHEFAKYMDKNERPEWNNPHVPTGLNLGGTPLNGAIVNLMEFIPKYRKDNGIQNLNFVTITDGASNQDGGKLVEKEKVEWTSAGRTPTGEMEWTTDSPSWRSVRFITDPVTKKNHRVEGRDGAAVTAAYLKILKDRTGCNTVGFYLTPSSKSGSIRKNDLHYLFPNQDHDAVRKEFRKNKVAVADSFGYDEYYIVPSGNMNVEADELEVSSDMTKGRMAKAFMKHMKSKTVNRILLNKFVEKIA